MGQVSPATSAIEHRPRQEALAPYARPHVGRSALDLATSVVPYLALSVGVYLLLGVSYPLALVLAAPATGFLLRTYVVFHDCAHGSFLPSKRGNAWLGTALGLLVFAPFVRWRHDHAVHHATSGDLDRRGVGDLPTITVAEYGALSPRRRLAYRLFRNPAVMFGLGPVVAMIVGPRIPARNARPRMRRSVIGTDIALAVLVGGLCWLVGWREYVMVALPPALLAGAAGIWLFCVQHQFEDAYWQSTSDSSGSCSARCRPGLACAAPVAASRAPTRPARSPATPSPRPPGSRTAPGRCPTTPISSSLAGWSPARCAFRWSSFRHTTRSWPRSTAPAASTRASAGAACASHGCSSGPARCPPRATCA